MVAVTDPMKQVNMAVDTDLTVVGTEVKSTVVNTAADMEVNNTVATTKDTSNTVIDNAVVKLWKISRV